MPSEDLQLSAEELIAEHTGRKPRYMRAPEAQRALWDFWHESVPGVTPGSTERRLTKEARSLGLENTNRYTASSLLLQHAVDDYVIAALYDGNRAAAHFIRAETFVEAVLYAGNIEDGLTAVRERVTSLRVQARDVLVERGLL